MIENPKGIITHVKQGDSWANRWCRCETCWYTSKCKPLDDFYVLGEVTETDKPLHCERCMWNSL